MQRLKDFFSNKYVKLTLYSLLFIVYVIHIARDNWLHEPWRDESRIWLLSRNCNFMQLIANLRTEGHPLFWHLISYPFAQMGLPYITLAIIHFIFVLGLAYIICFKMPFNIVFKFLLLFCTEFYFETATVVRGYVPSIVLLMLLALLWKNRYKNKKYTYSYAFILFWFANSEAISLGIACGIILAEFIDNIIEKRRVFNTIVIVGIIGVLFCLLTNMTDIFQRWQPYTVETGTIYQERQVSSQGFFQDITGRVKWAWESIAERVTKETVETFTNNKYLPLAKPLSLSIAKILLTIIAFAPIYFAKTKQKKIYVGIVSLISVFGITVLQAYVHQYFYTRHAFLITFGVVFSYWLAFEDREPLYKEHDRYWLCVNYVLIAIIALPLCLSFRTYKGMEDYDKTDMYGNGRAVAQFIKDSGYDRADTLIVTPRTSYFDPMLTELKNVRETLYSFGFASYYPWIKAFKDNETGLTKLADKELKKNPNKWKHVLIVVDQVNVKAMEELDKMGIKKIYTGNKGWYERGSVYLYK